jgi:hypothetical protein
MTEEPSMTDAESGPLAVAMAGVLSSAGHKELAIFDEWLKWSKSPATVALSKAADSYRRHFNLKVGDDAVRAANESTRIALERRQRAKEAGRER